MTLARFDVLGYNLSSSSSLVIRSFVLRFDAHLSEQGVQEATNGGKALKDAGYTFDLAHTSLLTRAQTTLQKVCCLAKALLCSQINEMALFFSQVLEGIDQTELPVSKTWRLNERHYGALTGLNKAETAAKHGKARII